MLGAATAVKTTEHLLLKSLKYGGAEDRPIGSSRTKARLTSAGRDACTKDGESPQEIGVLREG